MRRVRKLSLLIGAWAGTAFGADFPFYVTLRAGIPFFGGSFSEEIRIGPAAGVTAAGAQFNYGGPTQWWREGGQPQNFEIGYVAATNTGYVSVFNGSNVPTRVNFTNPAAPIDVNATWTIPAASFFVQTTGGIGVEGVSVSNLSFSSGVNVLNGALPASLTSTSGSAPLVSPSSTIVFNSSSAGGNWSLSGQIRFNGLFFSGGLGIGDTIQFGFGATGSSPLNSGSPTPEPASVLLLGAGMAATGLYARRRACGVRK